ncbi:MAG: hypothetical protein ACHREM_01330 [Polyangiales bacterium]
MLLLPLAIGCGGGASSNAVADATVDSTVDTGDDVDATSDADATIVEAATDSGPGDPSVLQFHNHASRDGVYVDPLVTRASAAKMHLDPTFHPTLDGHVYAQALYVENGPSGHGAFYVATENNNVYAIDESGLVVWTHNVGSNASGAEKCGNIQPLGITGTPVIDLARRAIYFDAARPGTTVTTLSEHEIHALSIDSGAELSGWPVVASTISYGTLAFNPKPQNQRGALLIVGNTLYVPYGGHSGDCTDNEGDPYHGWMIAVPLDAPSTAVGWATGSKEAGMWSVGGLASDGVSIYGATGNSPGGEVCPGALASSWQQQEAVLRFQPGAVWPGTTADFFAPTNWSCLDNGDVDLGSSNPVLFDVAAMKLLSAMGKNGTAYLVDRTNLGGIGGELASAKIATGELAMAPTAYSTPLGSYLVGYASAGGSGIACPLGAGNLVASKISDGSPPTLAVAWCANEQGQGSPIFTTTDGVHDPLVWAVGAETSDRLRAWDADTGAVVFDGGAGSDVVAGFRHFATVIVVKGRILAAADGALFAFTSE